MDANVSSDRIAVLIDAENTRAAYADEVLSEVAKYGNPTIKRVYGDWTNSHLTPWARRLNSLGLRAMHQNAFTKSKNSSDLALVIDAMDLLYDDNVEAFALVTSDSDFTSLAHRLRESGKTVYVLGENKAPDALKNACDKFIDLEVVQDEKKSDADGTRDDDREPTAPTPSRRRRPAADDQPPERADPRPQRRRRRRGLGQPGALGNQLTRTYPSFDARTFGNSGTRLSTLVADQPYLETSGSGNAMRVRRKGAAKAAAKAKAQAKAPAEGGQGREPEKARAPQAEGVDPGSGEGQEAPRRPPKTSRRRLRRRRPADEARVDAPKTAAED